MYTYCGSDRVGNISRDSSESADNIDDVDVDVELYEKELDDEISSGILRIVYWSFFMVDLVLSDKSSVDMNEHEERDGEDVGVWGRFESS